MLSSLHPYDYWVEDEQYHFKTPSGATYVAYFLKLPFADNLYTFNFDRLNPGVDGMVDAYVSDTICAILVKFFQNHLDSMLITCDSSDGREMVRKRLFESWYSFLLDLAEIWCGCSWRYNFACGNSVTTLPQILLKEK